MPNDDNRNGKTRLRSRTMQIKQFPVLSWETVKYGAGLVAAVGTILAYFFISQAGQDASAAETCERVTAAEVMARAHEKAIDEMKAYAEERRKVVGKLQQGVTRIETKQTEMTRFLEEQMREIKQDLKAIRERPTPP